MVMELSRRQANSISLLLVCLFPLDEDVFIYLYPCPSCWMAVYEKTRRALNKSSRWRWRERVHQHATISPWLVHRSGSPPQHFHQPLLFSTTFYCLQSKAEVLGSFYYSFINGFVLMRMSIRINLSACLYSPNIWLFPVASAGKRNNIFWL